MSARPVGPPPCRPHVIVAHSDPGYAAVAESSFRRRGWAVFRADSGPQARRLARLLAPALIVMEADLPGESGWLTCAKLMTESPDARVVLVGGGRPSDEAFAAFVGAARLVRPEAGVVALLEEAGAPVVHVVAG